MGDLNKRRGRVLGMTPGCGRSADYRSGYSDDRSIWILHRAAVYDRWKRAYEYEFVRYEQAPSDVQEKEIAKRAAEE